MKYGFVIPQNWGLENPRDVVDIGVRAESLGYDSVWVNHHILNIGYIRERLDDRPYYDALTVLTWVAALTERVRLGTTVLVLPYLNPLVLAKSVATLDVMSGGRVSLGVGVGMLRAENEALGSDFTTRGAYADESIRIMRDLWTSEDPSFSGRFFTYGGDGDGFKFAPKPVQEGGVPILIGGMSRAAMRRTAALGDGWHPNGGSLESLPSRIADLRALCESNGRDPDEVQLVIRGELDVTDAPSDDASTPLVGSVDQIRAAVESYAEMGVSELVMQVSGGDPDHIRRVQETFAEQVVQLT